MPETSVRKRLEQVFARELGIEKEDLLDSTIIQGEGSLIDSLDRVELLMGCETEFHIEIEEYDPDMNQVKTVGELITYLEKRCVDPSLVVVT